MGNRVYLYCTSATEIPRNDEWDNFFKHCGTEYETQYCIPLYWLIIFRESDIRILPRDHNGFSGDEREYPYLLGNRQVGIARLKQFSHLIKQGLGNIRHDTYLEWIGRLESENMQNIIVRTEELDWTYGEGEFEKDLRKTLSHLEVMSNQPKFAASNTVKDMCGIDVNDDFCEYESFVLVGSANDSSGWPARYAPPIPLSSVASQDTMPSRIEWGILTLPVAFMAAAFVSLSIDSIFGDGYYTVTAWPKLLGGIGAGLAVWTMGSFLNRRIPKNGNKYTFIWLQIEYWAPIAFLFWSSSFFWQNHA